MRPLKEVLLVVLVLGHGGHAATEIRCQQPLLLDARMHRHNSILTQILHLCGAKLVFRRVTTLQCHLTENSWNSTHETKRITPHSWRLVQQQLHLHLGAAK